MKLALFFIISLAIHTNCRYIKNPYIGYTIDTICNDIDTLLNNNNWAEITILYDNDYTEKKKFIWSKE